MRTVLLSKSDENYLGKCAYEADFAYGIIIGQHAEPTKDIVVHLAKNCEEDVDLPASDEQLSVIKVEDINTQALANQWVSANKMIPGSFNILGVFATSVNPNIVSEETFKSAKKILYDIHHLLISANSLINSVDSPKENELIFLAFTPTTRNVVCKSYETDGTNGGKFSKLDVRIVEKPFEWIRIECTYELNDVFPILEITPKINIEKQFQRAFKEVKIILVGSEIFIENENVADNLTLESFVRRKSNTKRMSMYQVEILNASIFLPLKCQISKDSHIRVRDFKGTIRLKGVISSRIWCNPKNVISDVKGFVRTDILRSIAARIQLYCDGLTEPNITGDAMFISEPPRRVYFKVPDSVLPQPIQFSEYIFRGEAPTVAIAQAKQILDLDVKTTQVIEDLEGLPDDDLFMEFPTDGSNISDQSLTQRELSRTMYLVGIVVALVVLAISVFMNYVMSKV